MPDARKRSRPDQGAQRRRSGMEHPVWIPCRIGAAIDAAYHFRAKVQISSTEISKRIRFGEELSPLGVGFSVRLTWGGRHVRFLLAFDLHDLGDDLGVIRCDVPLLTQVDLQVVQQRRIVIGRHVTSRYVAVLRDEMRFVAPMSNRHQSVIAIVEHRLSRRRSLLHQHR